MAAYPTKEQREHPEYCPVYAKRTPMIPFHNGMNTFRFTETDGSIRVVQSRCLGCGKTRG